MKADSYLDQIHLAVLIRIPKGVNLSVSESVEIQQGRVLGTWYKGYNGFTGWTSFQHDCSA